MIKRKLSKDIIANEEYQIWNSFIPKRNERSELVHSQMSAGKARVNTPRLAAEREPHERLRVQGLPWGMIPFIDVLLMESEEDLSEIQRNAQRACIYESEILNGGHLQYFENTGKDDFAECAMKAR